MNVTYILGTKHVWIKIKCKIKAIMTVLICTEKQKEMAILLIYAKIK